MPAFIFSAPLPIEAPFLAMLAICTGILANLLNARTPLTTPVHIAPFPPSYHPKEILKIVKR